MPDWNDFKPAKDSRTFWNLCIIGLVVLFFLSLPPFGVFTRFSTTNEFDVTFKSPATNEQFIPYNGTITFSGSGATSVGSDVMATVNLYRLPSDPYDTSFTSAQFTLAGAYLVNWWGQVDTAHGFPKLVTVPIVKDGDHWTGSAEVQYFEAHPVGTTGALGMNITFFGQSITSPLAGTTTIPEAVIIVPPFISVSDVNSTTTASSNEITIALTFLIAMLACIELRRGNLTTHRNPYAGKVETDKD